MVRDAKDTRLNLATPNGPPTGKAGCRFIADFGRAVCRLVA